MDDKHYENLNERVGTIERILGLNTPVIPTPLPPHINDLVECPHCGHRYAIVWGDWGEDDCGYCNKKIPMPGEIRSGP